MKEGFQNLIELKKVFARFKKIPNESYYDYIFFYQQYFDQIQSLPFDEYLDVRFSYLNALFHLDKMDLFHFQCDKLIRELLNYSDFSPYHKKIYIDALFLKAMTFVNDRKTNLSLPILKEIYKLDPSHLIVEKKLFKHLFLSIQHQDRKYYALIIAGLIFSLILTAVTSIVVEPFYPQNLYFITILRNSLFGLFMLLSAGILIKTYFQTNKMIKALRKK